MDINSTTLLYPLLLCSLCHLPLSLFLLSSLLFFFSRVLLFNHLLLPSPTLSFPYLLSSFCHHTSPHPLLSPPLLALSPSPCSSLLYLFPSSPNLVSSSYLICFPPLFSTTSLSFICLLTSPLLCSSPYSKDV